MGKNIFTLMICSCLVGSSFAQDSNSQNEALKKLQRLKVSGYIQTQYQWGEENTALNVGAPNRDADESFSRIGIRRGRIKFVYEEGIASGVFQLDATEKGVGIKDAYFNVKDPWAKTFALKAGIFDRPFGNEISYSSSRRESPERSAIFQMLFPGERDLGVSMTVQPSERSVIHFLKLEAGLFAGNGIRQETDSRKDFIGHLYADKKLGSVTIGGGVSYYNGSVYQGTENVYRMNGDAFILNSSADNKEKFAKREYIGFDAQLSINTVAGTTQLRAEYLFGEQPSKAGSINSPDEAFLPAHDTYIRNFNGGYVIFIQSLGRLPVCAVLKYDRYDPNTKVSKNGIGLKNTTTGDVAYNNFGLGMLWNINTSLRMQTYYEINKNEKSENLANYNVDRNDNRFTVRLQYKF